MATFEWLLSWNDFGHLVTRTALKIPADAPAPILEIGGGTSEFVVDLQQKGGYSDEEVLSIDHDPGCVDHMVGINAQPRPPHRARAVPVRWLRTTHNRVHRAPCTHCSCALAVVPPRACCFVLWCNLRDMRARTREREREKEREREGVCVCASVCVCGFSAIPRYPLGILYSIFFFSIINIIIIILNFVSEVGVVVRIRNTLSRWLTIGGCNADGDGDNDDFNNPPKTNWFLKLKKG